jgi:hypothetical protein
MVEKTSFVKQPPLIHVRKIRLLLCGNEDTNLDPSFQAVLTGLSQQLFCNKIQSADVTNINYLQSLILNGMEKSPHIIVKQSPLIYYVKLLHFFDDRY